MRARGQNRYQIIAVCLILLSVTLNLYPAGMLSTASVQPQPTLGSPPSPTNVNGTVTVSPAAVGDATNYPLGTKLIVSIKLANASSINQYKVAIATWPTILNPLSIGYGDVFAFANGQNFTEAKCINGHGLGCGLRAAGQDGPGVVTFSELSLAGPTINQTTSTLFQVMYNVTGKGATQIHILPPTLSSGAGGNTLAVGRVDGSFSNKNCGAALCKPPSVSVSVARNSTLVQQRSILFNASRSVPLNPSASIVSYDWIFGDGNGNVVTSPIVNYTYPGAGNFVVVVRVADSSNAVGFWSFRFHISRFFIDLVIGPDDLTIDHTTFVLQGTQINIGVTVENVGTQAVNSTLAVLLSLGDRGNLTLKSRPIVNLGINDRTNMTANWDTANYAPKVYRVIGRVDPVRNGTILVENVTSNNDISAFVQIVTISPAGLSLSVVSGVSLLSLIIIGVVVSLARRFFNRKPELEADLS
ncbi:PKD domain-containing protein [Candidatus Bathyarchaeota archaeon]|nr:MAG: PKD domain-containing protein [Candidatus Bathyarchaeota archaeon]